MGGAFLASPGLDGIFNLYEDAHCVDACVGGEYAPRFSSAFEDLEDVDVGVQIRQCLALLGGPCLGALPRGWRTRAARVYNVAPPSGAPPRPGPSRRTETVAMLKKRFFKTKDECEVAFELTAGAAERVELVCESNDWEPIEMKRAKGGTFRTRLRLPKQRGFQFRYLVDGTAWVTDDDADEVRFNEFGGQNGVLYTTPDSRPPVTSTD